MSFQITGYDLTRTYSYGLASTTLLTHRHLIVRTLFAAPILYIQHVVLDSGSGV